MNTRVYEYLLAIKEEKNITKAAERCYISQPAMSQQVHKLEEKLHIKIFETDKNSKQLFPTPRGKVVLETAEKILRVEKETLREIKNIKNENSKNVRIYIEQGFHNVFLQQIWPSVLADFPGIHLSLFSGSPTDAELHLNAGTADIAIIIFDRPISANYHYEKFQTDEYVVTLPKTHPQADAIKHGDFSPSCFDLDELLLRENYSTEETMQQKAVAYYGLSSMKIRRTYTFRQAAHETAQGHGISVLPVSLLNLMKSPVVIYRAEKPFTIFGYIGCRKEDVYHPLYISIRDQLKRFFSYSMENYTGFSR